MLYKTKIWYLSYLQESMYGKSLEWLGTFRKRFWKVMMVSGKQYGQVRISCSLLRTYPINSIGKPDKLRTIFANYDSSQNKIQIHSIIQYFFLTNATQKSDSRVTRIAKHSLLTENLNRWYYYHISTLSKTYQAILLVKREKEK